MQMKLSKRLQTVASFVPDNSYVIDVGCDHALLSIYLYLNKENVKVIASDINSNPLKIARENLIKYHLLDKIELVLQNGIENLNQKVDTIVIAGMGGDMIAKILADKDKLVNIKNIIVAPNCDTPIVRKRVLAKGFYLEDEKLVKENNKYYIITYFKRGKNKKDNYFFGILHKNNETIKYYQEIIKVNKIILNKIPKKYLIKRLKIRYQNILINYYIKK